MKAEDARRVHVNHCVRDDELEEAEKLHAAADPGAWRVNAEGAVVRWGGQPLERRASAVFMAASLALVPRFVKGIRVLEEALATAWREVTYLKAQNAKRAEEMEATARNAAAGRTGSERDLDDLATAAGEGALTAHHARILVREWAGGRDLAKEQLPLRVKHHREDLEREKKIREAVQAEAVEIRRQCLVLLDELELTKKERAAVDARARAKLG